VCVDGCVGVLVCVWVFVRTSGWVHGWMHVCACLRVWERLCILIYMLLPRARAEALLLEARILQTGEATPGACYLSTGNFVAGSIGKRKRWARNTEVRLSSILLSCLACTANRPRTRKEISRDSGREGSSTGTQPRPAHQQHHEPEAYLGGVLSIRFPT